MSFFNPNKIVTTAADFQQALKKGGMKAELRISDDMPPYILVWEQGITFIVGVSPEAFTFASTLNGRLGVDYEKIASWNVQKAFCRASYIEGRDRYLLSYALVATGGLLARNIQALAKKWPERVVLFANHLGLDKSDIVVPKDE